MRLSSSVNDAGENQETSWWNGPWIRHRWVFASVAFPLVLISVWVALSKLQDSSVAATEKLLTQAYTEQRTLELRIPRASHSDFRQRRMGDVRSLPSSPEPLRKATDRVASALKKHPDDPNWLLLSAQLDLLDWRYKSALATLDRIEADTDRRGIWLIRALALHEKAEMEHDPQAYRKVVEVMGKALQSVPDDPVALFNQAVACEKLYMYECASRDYEHLLKIEEDSGWAAEARDHLNRIRKKNSRALNLHSLRDTEAMRSGLNGEHAKSSTQSEACGSAVLLPKLSRRA